MSSGHPSEETERLKFPPMPMDSPVMQSWNRWRTTVGAHLKPIRTEWSIFCEKWDVAGQIDALYFNTLTNKWAILDWKCVKSMDRVSPWGKRGTGPCKHLPETNFSMYSIQLNIYRYIVEKNYGLEIDEMRLVQIHHTLEFPGFVEHPVERMPDSFVESLFESASSINRNQK